MLQQALTNLGLIRLWEMTQSQKDQDNVKPLSKDSVFKFIESRMVVTEPEIKTWRGGIRFNRSRLALHDKKKGGGGLATQQYNFTELYNKNKLAVVNFVNKKTFRTSPFVVLIKLRVSLFFPSPAEYSSHIVLRTHHPLPLDPVVFLF